MKFGKCERFGGVGICERGREKRSNCVHWIKATGQNIFCFAAKWKNSMFQVAEELAEFEN